MSIIVCDKTTIGNQRKDAALKDIGKKTVPVDTRTVLYKGFLPQTAPVINYSINDNSDTRTEGWQASGAGNFTGKSSISKFPTDPITANIANQFRTTFGNTGTLLRDKYVDFPSTQKNEPYGVTIVTKNQKPTSAVLYFCTDPQGNPNGTFSCPTNKSKTCTVVYTNNTTGDYTVRDYQASDDTVGP